MGVLTKALRLEPDAPGVIADPRHGPVTVTPGRPYVVESASLGRLELDTVEKWVRIGDERGKLLRSKVVGARSADNVRVAIARHDVHLRQRARDRADVRLDGEVVAELDRTRRMRADLDRFREEYEISWRAPVEPGVALVVHALASRFGVGAPGMLVRSLDLFA